MKTLYFDCFSGISGDMTVAALLSLGADAELLEKTLAKLSLPVYKLSHFNCVKNGISARRFEVICDAHEHQHRTLRDILEIFDRAQLPKKTDALAREIFTIIARAEAKIHSTRIEDVHFHEVGAVDSIVDAVAVAECIRQISPDRIVFSKIREGQGMIECAHGQIPVPAPATLEIINEAGAILSCTDTMGEMVTPTGAGIAAVLGDEFGVSLPEGKVLAIGYGAGSKDFSHPNVLRTALVEESCDANDLVTVLETQVDDMTGEQLGFAMEKLFSAGALDAYFTPIFMKKNRPATQITVICNSDKKDYIGEVLLKHTSTLGYRVSSCERKVMAREMLEVETQYGVIPVKCAEYHGIRKFHPEFDAVCNAARSADVSVSTVLSAVDLQLYKL